MCKERVLFIDVDGVLNDLQFDKRNVGFFDVKKIKMLAKIVEATKARIVLSSTWRYLKDCDEKKEPQAANMWKCLNNTFTKYGMQISDITPVIDGNRPKEISEYLKTHENLSWCSIEDDFSAADYEKYGISEYLVQTKYFVNKSADGGLKEEHIEKVMQIFKEQEKERGNEHAVIQES